MPTSRVRVAAAVGAAALLLPGCSAADGEDAERGPAPSTSPSTGPSSTDAPATATPSDEVVTPAPAPEPPPYVVSDGRARDARMSIPALGITDLEVQTYRGFTDDAPGHAIQNTGIAASPSGPRGGTGPGGVGNYQVTGHRTSSTRIFEFLPDLRRGEKVLVTAGDTTYVYRVTTTRITSFRSERSLREQRAAVPGRPGAEPTRAMITISTCRTQEDHAEGNYWSDEFDNPEHRIDKIGVLVRTRPA
ncbi:sortase [Nocardioides sp. C4-1]|uniref:sortase domain-containing protein n=1 Tax=Nocardioides sp. C4-1 TaxID=3151851 RepID=UPI00326591C2